MLSGELKKQNQNWPTHRMLAWPEAGMLKSLSKISTSGNLARIFSTCRSYTGTMTHPSRCGGGLPETRDANSTMTRTSCSKGPRISSLAWDKIAKRIRRKFQSRICGSCGRRGGTAWRARCIWLMLRSDGRDHGDASHTGCVGCPSTMDCSHSMAEEDTVGQTGGSSYTAPT